MKVLSFLFSVIQGDFRPLIIWFTQNVMRKGNHFLLGFPNCPNLGESGLRTKTVHPCLCSLHVGCDATCRDRFDSLSLHLIWFWLWLIHLRIARTELSPSTSRQLTPLYHTSLIHNHNAKKKLSNSLLLTIKQTTKLAHWKSQKKLTVKRTTKPPTLKKTCHCNRIWRCRK